MRDTFVKILSEHAENDKNIKLITGDLGFGVLTEFQKRFPEQYFNAGVAEQGMTGIAAGMAMEGNTVFTYSIANFPTLRALEQIRNDICYHNANVKIVAIGGGFSYGQLGFSHHATEDLGILRSLPEMNVIVPGDKYETEKATEYIIKTKGPFYLRLDKSYAESYENKKSEFIPNKARVLKKGSDIAIIGCGGILEEALLAANEAENSNISCQVVSLPFIKPMDKEFILDTVRNFNGIITLEENILDAGLGSAISEVFADNLIYPKQFKRLGLENKFSTKVGDQFYLRKEYGLDKQAVLNEILKMGN